MKVDNRIWVLVTAVLSIGVLAAAWFLGVDPQLQSMTTSSTQLATVSASSEATRAQIASLRTAKQKLPELKQKLAGLQKSVPPGVAGASFIAELNSLASSTGVQLNKFTLGAPVDYAPPVSPTASAAGATGAAAASPSASASPSPSATATAAPPVSEAVTKAAPPTDALITADNFVMIPVDVEVAGANGQVLAFLSSLQHGDRLVLVTALSKAQQDGADGAAVDSYHLTITGFVYALKNKDAEAKAAASNG